MNKTPIDHNQNILTAIGNTPLVKLAKIPDEKCADIYVKLEYLNPTGSYKDRMALAIISEAEKRGDLKKGMTVVECTAGGTGTSLALVCTAKGYRFKVISSDAFAPEKLKMISLFGAELDLVKSETGQITPDLIPRMIAMAEELGKSKENYWTGLTLNARMRRQRDRSLKTNRTSRRVELQVAGGTIAPSSRDFFVGSGMILRKPIPLSIRRVFTEPALSSFAELLLLISNRVPSPGLEN